MRVLGTCVILWAALIQSGHAYASTITSVVSKEGKVVVSLNGEISPGDAGQFTSLVQSANAAGRFVSGIRLNSPGGDLAEGIKLSDLIRGAKIATVVPNGSICASACFVAFAAGTEKYASYNGFVGVHGASENGTETPGSSAATIAMARIVKDLGVPAEILGRMVVTPPSQVVWLSPNDLRAMGTVMTGKPAQVASLQIPAQVPQAPQLNSQVQANVVPTSSQFLDVAMKQSAKQNNGTPNFSRQCQPEMKVCSTAIFYKDDKGASMMLRTAENVTGQTTAREVCQFNNFGDVRNCFDWDRGTKHTDMRDAAGAWQTVAN